MRTLAALGTIVALVASPVAAAQGACLNASDAESIALVAMPDIIRDAGRVCARLPATSLLRRQSGEFLAKYDREADRAWPAARTAIAKLSDPAVELLLLSDYARPMLTSIFAPQISGRIQPADCPTLDRLVTLLEPLPPRNTAGIVVATLQYLKAEKNKGKRTDIPDLPVCPAS
ncbi:hypothetical protein ASE95_10610 [Sphingomonas sp. Leaf231]|uniref:hypothetical protein n=1 Tax=Sphingomonas sp. Leaf231 TaxID=1736301 RepID=UPI0006F881B5|nr:hypothetical protein [Sphingomonas sp. Leaf231]KQN93026.1 hypothetical protein ASE95_10610 [Sphingomonas sp. Leaf231]